MHAIRINDEFLDLGNNVLSLTLNCPVFDPQRIARTFSYPGTVDATPKNDHIFQHARRLDSITGAKKYEADLFIDGQFFDTGVFVITGTSNKSYSYVFKNKTLDIVDELKAFKLRSVESTQYLPELFCPDILISGGEFSAGVDPNRSHYLIEIGGIIFSRVITEQQEFVDDINNVYPGMALLIQQSAKTATILLKCLDSFNPVQINLNPSGYSESDYYLFHLAPANNSLIDQAIEAHQAIWKSELAEINSNSDSHVFPAYRNPNQFIDKEDFLFRFSGYINYIINNAYFVNTFPQTVQAWNWSISPMVKLPWILEQIRLNTSISDYDGAFAIDPEILSLVFYSNKTLDKLVDIPALENEYLNIWADRYDLTDHIPDISAFDLFQSLGNDFCLIFRFIDSRFEMEPCRDILTRPIDDWTHLATPTFRAKTATFPPISLRYTRDEDEPRLDDQLEELDGGTEAKEYTLNYYTAFDEKGSDRNATGRRWSTPLLHEEGTSDPIGLNNQSAVRLLFYRGLHQDSTGNNYPLAQHGNENYNEEPTGNYSLAWNGPAGRYEQWFKEFIKLETEGDQVTKKMRFSVNDLLEMRNFRSVRKRIYHEEGEMVGVVKSIQIKSYPNRHISEATIKFIQE